jgi:hypothetical protein
MENPVFLTSLGRIHNCVRCHSSIMPAEKYVKIKKQNGYVLVYCEDCFYKIRTPPPMRTLVYEFKRDRWWTRLRKWLFPTRTEKAIREAENKAAQDICAAEDERILKEFLDLSARRGPS